jgi:NADPH:quinone reductase-like Zn-dependent oxidoreductase
MRAIVVRSFGGPEVLRPELVPVPVPAPGELLVEVVAAGVNPVDAGNCADGSWAGISLPFVRSEYPLDQAAAAHREMARGGIPGKTVLRARPEPAAGSDENR